MGSDHNDWRPPRVLVIWSDHWHRASLRAALREIGYDAVGARSVAEAFGYPAFERGRAPVSLIVIEADEITGDADRAIFERIQRLHPTAPVLLLARASRGLPPGEWPLILRRPFSLGDVLAMVRNRVTVAAGLALPLDAQWSGFAQSS